MAFLAPVAVVVVGATIGIVLLWVKVIRESRSDRRAAATLQPKSRLRFFASRFAPSGLGPIVAAMVGLEGRARLVPRGARVDGRARRLGDACDRARAARSRRSGGARAFLEPEGICHDPFLLGDMAAAVERLRAAVERGEQICVHGDYDVDGICATALAMLTLRELGADVSGISRAGSRRATASRPSTIARLAEEGVKLILTVDCGITAAAEVEEARRLGIDMIVTDHHRPGDALPDCPIVATRPSDYPFPDLCGTGVVAKLAQALLGLDHPAVARHADLSRSRRSPTSSRSSTRPCPRDTGLRGLARTQKPGLRALMRVAGVDPATVDATAVAFRLARGSTPPAGSAVPTSACTSCLREDEREADMLANELETLNRDRQAVEERILREAVAAVDAWSPEKRSGAPTSSGAKGWHEGVIGIVASRLVERFGPPGRPDRRRGRRLEGIGAVGAELRPPRRPHRLFRPPGALRRPSCRGRPHDPGRPARAVRRRLCRPRRRRSRRRRPVTRDPDRRHRSAQGAHARARLASSSSWRRSASEPRCDAARRQPARRSAPRPSARASTSASACGSKVRTPAVRSRSVSAAQLQRLQGRAHFDVAFRVQQNRWNGAVAPHWSSGACSIPRPLTRSYGVAGRALAGRRVRVDTRGWAHLRRAHARGRSRQAAAARASRPRPSAGCSSMACPCLYRRLRNATPVAWWRGRGLSRRTDRSSSAMSRSTRRRSTYRRIGPMDTISSASGRPILSLERARVH